MKWRDADHRISQNKNWDRLGKMTGLKCGCLVLLEPGNGGQRGVDGTYVAFFEFSFLTKIQNSTTPLSKFDFSLVHCSTVSLLYALV
jgi:hypothetical protein